MAFIDVILWVCMAVFLVGTVFIFEVTLSSLLGFVLLLVTCVFFASFFWAESMIVFGILFTVVALLAIRFIFREISNRIKKY